MESSGFYSGPIPFLGTCIPNIPSYLLAPTDYAAALFFDRIVLHLLSVNVAFNCGYVPTFFELLPFKLINYLPDYQYVINHIPV